jgi:hypothetical protein
MNTNRNDILWMIFLILACIWLIIDLITRLL